MQGGPCDNLPFGNKKVYKSSKFNFMMRVDGGPFLSTTLIAYRESVLFAPAMNRRMWENPVIKRKVATLQDLGHIVLDPQTAISVTQSSSGAVGPNMKELVRAAKYLSMRSLRRERLG